jgi:hypothetical protein
MIGAVRRLGMILVVATLMSAARSAAEASPPDTPDSPDTIDATSAPSADHGGRNRLLFLPDAMPVRPGGGYLALHDLFIPSFAVGITGFFSIAAGASIVPGLDRQYVMIAPKVVPYSTANFAIAAGLLYAARRGDAGAGIAFAEITSDGDGGSGTFGLGWRAAGDGTGGRPVIIAGFRVPVPGGFDIVSENWFPPNLDPAILSIGWRYSTGRVAVDLAACLNAQPEGGGASLLPWISLAYHY